ncbi:AAA family ATPase [Phaeobacter sp. J2-8]|uniref:AAA family ATPase n=1 Tax=Phaeobacter sp. J2-8 TaxID=2931394 RepID=UPI001FD15657|nr:AAA family ATPase [Phaeobacter sp. J2-8]MCJ7872814.1 AAA family ATPase [Phaeobacter sp. J2-8]
MPLDNSTNAHAGQASPCAANTDLSDLLCVSMGLHASQNDPLNEANRDLLAAGASLHWLHAGEKRPVAANWSNLPNQTESDLLNTYREGRNIGVRLGFASKIGDEYLHLIDLDVRDPAKAADAWAALLDLWPEAKGFPTVVSGSGGDSRHIYFLSPDPMPKRKLAKGEGWEIDLMGTGSQAVLPPSIYPTTGQPYVWERPFHRQAKISRATLGRFAKGRAPDVSSTDLSDLFRERADRTEVRLALAMINDADDRDTWLHIGMALKAEYGDTEEAFGMWSHWSRQSIKFNERGQRTAWKSFRGGAIGIGTLFEIAKAYGWAKSGAGYCADDFDDILPLQEMLAPAASRLTFLTPDECDGSEARKYVIKGLLSHGDVGCIFGAPGAGKSLAGPFLGYMVALGKEAFGMRTRQGKVFYVAAEDHHGMKGRVKALRREYGGTDAFSLVGGISRLLPSAGEKRAPDLQALLDAVEAQRPDLIFIDTLAVAFGSFDENSAEPMNQIVRIARALSTWGVTCPPRNPSP